MDFNFCFWINLIWGVDCEDRKSLEGGWFLSKAGRISREDWQQEFGNQMSLLNPKTLIETLRFEDFHSINGFLPQKISQNIKKPSNWNTSWIDAPELSDKSFWTWRSRTSNLMLNLSIQSYTDYHCINLPNFNSNCSRKIPLNQIKQFPKNRYVHSQ